MEYLRLHKLLRARQRDQVVDPIKSDGDAEEIFAASPEGAGRGFRQAMPYTGIVRSG